MNLRYFPIYSVILAVAVFNASKLEAETADSVNAAEPIFESAEISTNSITLDPNTISLASVDVFASDPIVKLAQSVGTAAVAAQVAEEARLKAEADEKAVKEAKEEADLKRRRITSRVFRLNNVSADEVANRLNTMWTGDFGVTWKVSKIAQAFTESNCVVVTAPAMILDACAEIIRDIDVEVPQVYIEARFIELSNNASHKLGIDWQMLDGMKGSLALDAG